MITTGSQLSNLKSLRGSVIPYFIRKSDGKIYFLFGIDWKTNDITCFGGGIKKTEYSLKGGIREFREETREIFNSEIYDINQKSCCVGLYTKQMSVIFVPVKEEWHEKAVNMFMASETRENYLKKGYNEISRVVWIEYSDFLSLLHPKDRRMWGRIKKFYRKEFDGNNTIQIEKNLRSVHRILVSNTS